MIMKKMFSLTEFQENETDYCIRLVLPLQDHETHQSQTAYMYDVRFRFAHQSQAGCIWIAFLMLLAWYMYENKTHDRP